MSNLISTLYQELADTSKPVTILVLLLWKLIQKFFLVAPSLGETRQKRLRSQRRETKFYKIKPKFLRCLLTAELSITSWFSSVQQKAILFTITYRGPMLHILVSNWNKGIWWVSRGVQNTANHDRDLNQSSAIPWISTNWLRRDSRVTWSTLSKAAVRSSKTSWASEPASVATKILFKTLRWAVSVLWEGRKPG